jgi:hypothetical protein
LLLQIFLSIVRSDFRTKSGNGRSLEVRKQSSAVQQEATDGVNSNCCRGTRGCRVSVSVSFENRVSSSAVEILIIIILIIIPSNSLEVRK